MVWEAELDLLAAELQEVGSKVRKAELDLVLDVKPDSLEVVLELWEAEPKGAGDRATVTGGGVTITLDRASGSTCCCRLSKSF